MVVGGGILLLGLKKQALHFLPGISNTNALPYPYVINNSFVRATSGIASRYLHMNSISKTNYFKQFKNYNHV